MTKMERRAVAERLKEACALRGTPITIKHVHSSDAYIRVLPGKASQFWSQDSGYPVFRSLSLQIVREEAVALGLTHVRGLTIDPMQDVRQIQEEYHFRG